MIVKRRQNGPTPAKLSRMTAVPRTPRSSLSRHKLCTRSELDVNICVHKGGQSFTWQVLDDHSWCNVISGHLVVLSHHDDDDDENVYFECAGEYTEIVNSLLRDYFRLDTDLQKLLMAWEEKDGVFKKMRKPEGVRVLRIDPWECLLSFICSQNNAIYRILNMVITLKRVFGRPLCILENHDGTCVDLYTFPEISTFANHDDKELERMLREQGFGYRAKYFGPVARRIGNHDALLSLRTQPYDTVVEYLQALPGVGPKVADCVALYSLDQLSAVPIDTHILRVALSHYATGLGSGKAMTPAVYKKISQRLRDALGDKAGWAQAVLFVSQLKVFRIGK